MGARLDDWYFEECIEAGEGALIVTAIRLGQIEIESRDCVDRTALMVALELNKTDLVESLLSLGADPSSESNDGQTCLSRAIEASNLDALKLLVAAGADLELASVGYYTPACTCGCAWERRHD